MYACPRSLLEWVTPIAFNHEKSGLSPFQHITLSVPAREPTPHPPALALVPKLHESQPSVPLVQDMALLPELQLASPTSVPVWQVPHSPAPEALEPSKHPASEVPERCHKMGLIYLIHRPLFSQYQSNGALALSAEAISLQAAIYPCQPSLHVARDGRKWKFGIRF